MDKIEHLYKQLQLLRTEANLIEDEIIGLLPYKVGDRVTIKDKDIIGTINSINIRNDNNTTEWVTIKVEDSNISFISANINNIENYG